jgi:hypothetical protein
MPGADTAIASTNGTILLQRPIVSDRGDAIALSFSFLKPLENGLTFVSFHTTNRPLYYVGTDVRAVFDRRLTCGGDCIYVFQATISGSKCNLQVLDVNILCGTVMPYFYSNFMPASSQCEVMANISPSGFVATLFNGNDTIVLLPFLRSPHLSSSCSGWDPLLY